MCIVAHERKLRKHDVSREAIQSAVRIAATIHAVAGAGALELREAALTRQRLPLPRVKVWRRWLSTAGSHPAESSRRVVGSRASWSTGRAGASCCCAPIATGISPRASSRPARIPLDARAPRSHRRNPHRRICASPGATCTSRPRPTAATRWPATTSPRPPTEAVTLPVRPELARPEHHECRWLDYDEALSSHRPRVEPVLKWAAGAGDDRPHSGARSHQAETTAKARPQEVFDVRVISSSARWRASRAAHAVCGVTIRFGRSARRADCRRAAAPAAARRSAAPPMRRARSASTSAATVDERAACGVDQRRVRIQSASSRAPISSRVAGVERAVQAQHVREAAASCQVDDASGSRSPPGRSRSDRACRRRRLAARATTRASVPKPTYAERRSVSSRIGPSSIVNCGARAHAPSGRKLRVLPQVVREQQHDAEHVLHDRRRAVVADVGTPARARVPRRVHVGPETASRPASARRMPHVLSCDAQLLPTIRDQMRPE